MAVGKEIRTKISSIRSTQKITSAMELVAASKMRKAQERMQASRPYAKHIQGVAHHVAKSHSEYHHPFLLARDVKSVGLVIVSTDRGLCGGLNINLFRRILSQLEHWEQQGVTVKLAIIGVRGQAFFKRLKAEIVAMAEHLGETPEVKDIIGSVKVMIDMYHNEEIDELHVAYNGFVNSMTQKPEITALLPLTKIEGTEAPAAHKGHWDYIYEPDARTLLNLLLERYIESMVYQAVVENGACEQAARMVAMKSATDNAGDIINDLQLVYNKARQASITQELSEIVSGAAAV